MRAAELKDRIAALARPEVLQLPRYETGPADETSPPRGGIGRLIRLATNESPVGASPLALRALHDACITTSAYPDPASLALRREIAAHIDLSPDRIAVGNGSENLIETLCQVFLRPNEDVVTSCPSFGLHVIYPLMMGARVRKICVNTALEFDPSAWEDAVRSAPKLVLLSNPSNPVGCILNRDGFDRLLRAMRASTLLVVDEAYHEYATSNSEYPDTLHTLAAHTGPWIVLRTFSKAYGLAGLRVGYAIASDAMIVDLLDRVRTPYNVNRGAQEAAIASLQDSQHVAMGVALVTSERQRLAEQLHASGFAVAPSQANFLFVDTHADSLSITHRLLDHGILVKPWREPGFEHFIRVTIGTAENNNRFMTALRACASAASQEYSR